MSDLVLYRCCEHCITPCRNPNQHAILCGNVDLAGRACEQGREVAS